MVEETKQFATKHNLDHLLMDLFNRAYKANTNFPLNYIAEEIYKMSGSEHENKELSELRKKNSRFHALLEHLKNRDATAKVTASEDEEKMFSAYCDKHDLRNKRVELISISYMAGDENPLLFIANYISKQPDYKIILQRESVLLLKRAVISQSLIQRLINEKPMGLKEIEAFSQMTIKKEHGKAVD